MKLAPYSLALVPFILPASAGKVANSIGCFGTSGSFQNQGSFTFQSVNHCVDLCDEAGFKYAAVQNEDCWCGDADPVQEDLVPDDKCDEACPGYAKDICGGDNAWSVFGVGGVRPVAWLSTSSTNAMTYTSTTTESESSTYNMLNTNTSFSTTSDSTTSTSTSPSVASASSPSHAASDTPSAASTSVEPTPTENSASRRLSFHF